MGKILAITLEKFLRSLRARPPFILPLKLSSIPPLNYHPPLPLVKVAHAVRQHAAWLQVSYFQCGHGAFELQPETEEVHVPANQDVTDCLLKLFEQPIVAVSVNEKKNFFKDFFKKAENHL